MPNAASATESYQSPEDPQNGDTVRGPYLVVALNCANPSMTPLRVSIAKAERIELRRDDRRRVNRGLVDGERVCQLGIGDPTMSGLHAFIVQDVSGSFRLWDCGSKNGTTLNGIRIDEPTTLVDGDLIGVGCTFFLFRSAADCYLYEPFDVEALDAPMATANPTFARSVVRVKEIAHTDLPVPITGPPGSGRSVAARLLHEQSGVPGPLVRIPCSSILQNLASLRRADKGTLYLEGVEDLDARASAVLASVLDPSEWSDTSRPGQSLSIRVIASGLPDAKSKLAPRTAGRVAGYVFELPALAERREDIGLFIARALREASAPSETKFERPAARALLGHGWPGNLHELREAIRHGSAPAGAEPIGRAHLPKSIVQSERNAAKRRDLIVLRQRHKGNVSAIAREMSISRIQVHRLAKDHALSVDAYRNK